MDSAEHTIYLLRPIKYFLIVDDVVGKLTVPKVTQQHAKQFVPRESGQYGILREGFAFYRATQEVPKMAGLFVQESMELTTLLCNAAQRAKRSSFL